MQRVWLAAGAFGLAASLGGCTEVAGPGGQAVALDVPAAIARGDLHSPRLAGVALASLEGAPEPVMSRLRQGLAAEASGRDVTLTDASSARYYLRGYLDAYPTETGTSVHYVWDLFDSTKQRRQRVDEALDLPRPGAAGDPWSSVDDTVLASMAARSADDIAIALSGTPEAAGSAGPVPATAGSQTPSVN